MLIFLIDQDIRSLHPVELHVLTIFQLIPCLKKVPIVGLIGTPYGHPTISIDIHQIDQHLRSGVHLNPLSVEKIIMKNLYPPTISGRSNKGWLITFKHCFTVAEVATETPYRVADYPGYPFYQKPNYDVALCRTFEHMNPMVGQDSFFDVNAVCLPRAPVNIQEGYHTAPRQSGFIMEDRSLLMVGGWGKRYFSVDTNENPDTQRAEFPVEWLPMHGGFALVINRFKTIKASLLI